MHHAIRILVTILASSTLSICSEAMLDQGVRVDYILLHTKDDGLYGFRVTCSVRLENADT